VRGLTRAVDRLIWDAVAAALVIFCLLAGVRWLTLHARVFLHVVPILMVAVLVLLVADRVRGR
jgi:hypothetical protein